jgi:hypothetical protein
VFRARLAGVLLAALAASPGRSVEAACAVDGVSAYVGRFVAPGWSPEGYVDVRVREGALTWGPALWRPARRLVRVSNDTFQIEDFAERRVRFGRDARGCVATMTTEGLPFDARLRRRAPGAATPLARLLGGSAEKAVPDLLKEAGGAVAPLVALGRRMLNVPSQRGNARRLAAELTRRFPRSAAAFTLRGEAELVGGVREAAVASFRAALTREGGSPAAAGALAMLIPPGPSPAESTLPFTLEEMLREPSPAEIDGVRAAWPREDLTPRDVAVVRTADVVLGGVVFAARLVLHGVPGRTEYGVILVPKDATAGSRPVLVEAKGVSWNFSPLRIPEGLSLPGILGGDVGKFILVVPGFRGEEVRFLGEPFRSPSAHESWSGAVEDLLGLLNVALATTPEADPSRVGVFGRSRGGSVALLAAARDARIRCVVSWAAPADWLRAMAPEGVTQREAAADALRRDAKLGEPGGQFLYNFLRFARTGSENLDAVRRRLLASSPLYFADSLPPAELHYGLEDAIVPERNARAIAERLGGAAGSARRVTILRHAGAGHDQDLFDAPRQTRAFLLRLLENPPIY